MLDAYVSKMFSPKKIASVEVEIQAKGKSLYKIVVLSEKGGEIGLDGEVFETDSIEELKKKIPEKIPLVLTLTGKAILLRFWDKKGKESVETIFPVRSISEYHLEEYNSKEESWAALAHKKNTEQVIDEISESELEVLNVFYGYLPVIEVSDLLDQVSLIEVREKIKKGHLLTEGFNNEQISVSEIEIEGKYINCFSAGLLYLIQKNEGNFLLNEKRTDYAYRQFMEKTPKVFLLSVLLLVILNYGAMSFIESKSSKLDEQLLLNSVKSVELEKLKKEYKITQQVVSQQDWSSSEKAAFYLDRLAESIEDQLTLRSLSLNPQEGKDFDVKFLDNTLIVGGLVDKLSKLDEWVSKLKQKEWVDYIEIEEIKTDRDRKDFFRFQIKIKTR